MTTMKLIWKYGEEAICPRCGHGNACIGDYTGTYTCRDCRRVYRPVTGRGPVVVGKDEVLGRKIVEQECVEVK